MIDETLLVNQEVKIENNFEAPKGEKTG